MKIVDITHFYNHKSGGVRRYIQLKAKFLSNFNNIQHYVIVPAEEDGVDELFSSTVFYVKSPEVFFWKPYRLIVSKKKVGEILFHIEPDIVEVGSPFILPKMINQLKQLLGYKTVGFFHSNIETSFFNVFNISSQKMSTFIRKYIHSNYQGFDVILSPSELTKKYLNSVGLTNVEVVRIGIDTEVFRPDDKVKQKIRWNIPDGKISVLYVGRFSKDKGIYDLVDVIKTLDTLDEGRFFFHLVGAGPEENRLRQLLNKDNFRITPYIESQQELASVYNSADVFISCSTSDTYGISVLEAQACGVPVVAYTGTSFQELVLHKQLLASSKYEMIKILSHFNDVYDRQQLYNYIITNFSLERCYSQLLEVYGRLYKAKESVVI